MNPSNAIIGLCGTTLVFLAIACQPHGWYDAFILTFGVIALIKAFEKR